MKDSNTFNKYADLCAEQFCAHGNQALITRYERLAQDVGNSVFGISVNRSLSVSNRNSRLTITDRLAACHSAKERANCILKILLDKSFTTEGFLYTVQKQGPMLSATIGPHRPTKELEATVRDFIAAEIDDSNDITITSMEMDTTFRSITAWTGTDSKQYRPLLLGHHTDNGYAVTGLAILPFSTEDQLSFPTEIIITLSRALLRSGDVALQLSSDITTQDSADIKSFTFTDTDQE